MKRASRGMSPAPVRRPSRWAWLFLVGMLAAIGYWGYRQPSILWLLLVRAVITGIQIVFDTRRQRRLATSRAGENIRRFARSFERQTDTWVVRSVYEEFSRFHSIDDQSIPVRRQDRWEKDLRIDPEDLEDLIKDVAFRDRRSMDGCDKTPLHGNVTTVGDIVTFLEHQPIIVEPSGGSIA